MNARALFPSAAKRYRIARRATDIIHPSSPRPMRRDCHGRLLTALLHQAGEDSEIRESGITAWASATFIGARHSVALAVRGADMLRRSDTLQSTLPEADFALAGHIVADLSVDGSASHMGEDGEAEMVLTLSILTIEAW